MIVTNVSIDRRITVFVLVGLIIISGIYSYVNLPRESNPEIVIPILTITTTYRGVAPADIESLVTMPIERNLAGLSGIKSMRSDSMQGLSSIQIEFETGLGVDTLHQKVRDRVDQATPDLPPDVDAPIIAETNVSDFPFMYVSMLGEVAPADLTTLAEDLADEIESISGILSARIIGGVQREIQIVVDPYRLNTYQVPLSRLTQLPYLENVNIPAGSLNMSEARYLMRIPGEFKKADELRDLVVKSGGQGAVYLRDIADIRDDYKFHCDS